MILPAIQGQQPTAKEFIFTASDFVYFYVHAIPLINSILKNTQYDVHIHLFNPTPSQLLWCQRPRVTCSHEHVDPEQFRHVGKLFRARTSFDNTRQKEMALKGLVQGEQFMTHLVEQTYYACARFVRLSEIFKDGSTCLAIDVDGIVRRNFSLYVNDKHDVFLYQKKCGGHLAGALLLTETAAPFITEFGNTISTHITNDDIYWFMDQVVLDEVVSRHNTGLLPMSYIDWEMAMPSSIWSAKGKRKELEIFTAEQMKYRF